MVAAVIILFAMRIGYAGKTLSRLLRSARSAVHVVAQRIRLLETNIVNQVAGSSGVSRRAGAEGEPNGLHARARRGIDAGVCLPWGERRVIRLAGVDERHGFANPVTASVVSHAGGFLNGLPAGRADHDAHFVSTRVGGATRRVFEAPCQDGTTFGLDVLVDGVVAVLCDDLRIHLTVRDAALDFDRPGGKDVHCRLVGFPAESGGIEAGNGARIDAPGAAHITVGSDVVWIQTVIGPDAFVGMHVRPGSLPECDRQSEWQLVGLVGKVAVHDMVGQLRVRYRVRLVFRRGSKPPPPVVPQAASGVRRAMMVAAVISLFAMRIGYAENPTAIVSVRPFRRSCRNSADRRP